ncbi:MAG: RDD family protein, partial [Micromonosporaceae bacterium]
MPAADPGAPGGASAYPAATLHAGVVSRGTAFLLDAVGTTVVIVATFWVLGILGTVLQASRLTKVSQSGTAVFSIVDCAAFLLYCAVAWRLAGRTIGQALLGLRVVRTDGRPLKAPACLLRAAGYMLSAILLLGFVWVCFASRRQGFHDKIARSVVIYDWPAGRSLGQ